MNQQQIEPAHAQSEDSLTNKISDNNIKSDTDKTTVNTAEQILYLLKTRGPQSAQQLAILLALTSMGARRQLESWQQKGIVSFIDHADKVGRPNRQWQLTSAGHARFPDRHGELTVQLIAQVRQIFGEHGIEQLISAREKDTEAVYSEQLNTCSELAQKVQKLAELRSNEGYMAKLEILADGNLLLIEDHCPICAASKTCQNFCRSELSIFQRILGPDCSVERTEHLHSNARRCAYLIRKI